MRPMLGDLELETVQRIETEEGQVLTRHQIPALEGDFLQRLGRRGSRVSLAGVAVGPEARERLQELRTKVRTAEAVDFVSDIATATRLSEVLVEELDVREIAGRPERFEVALALRELTEPPAAESGEEEVPADEEVETEVTEAADEDAEETVEQIEDEVGTLVVEVLVEGQEDFDFGQVTVTARGTDEDGEPFSRILTDREDNVWTATEHPAAEVTVEAVTSSPRPAVASAAATVAPGEATTTTLTLTLRPGTPVATAFVVHFHFDNAFVEPCMRSVLKAAADRAGQGGSAEKVLIVGHTDKTGPDEYNQSLSERRARSVFAFLTFGRDPEGAVAEWTALRQRRPPGVRKTEKDSWGVREYQHMLQDLGFYPGKIDGRHGDLTDDAVRAFRCKKGLPPGTIVDDPVWELLIEDYLGKEPLAVADDKFLRNAKGSCDSGPLEWLGCGEQQPLPEPQPTKRTAHRPYRRTEILFVTVDELPCDVKEPDTFKLPPPPEGEPEPTWCLAAPGEGERCCFATRKADEASGGRLLIENAETGTLTVEGRIENEDGTPFAGKRFVLLAPDGTIKRSESSRGEPQEDRTGADGSFRYENLPVGVYTLEVRERVLVHLKDAPESSITGNSVCKTLSAPAPGQAPDRFDVVVSSAPVLREIKLPVVAHLMTALEPASRRVRSCPDPLDPGRRHPQATRHDAAAVGSFFDGANDVWRQARIRFDPVRVIEETFATHRDECEVTGDEFGAILHGCAYPNVVNVFFFGDIEGSTEAGVYLKIAVTDPRGTVDGCAVTDRHDFTIFTPPLIRQLDEDETVQVLAHELGHFFGLDHVEGPDRLMLAETFGGDNRAVDSNEAERSRRSCNANLECAVLGLEVEGAARIGVEGSHEHIVARAAGGRVTVTATIPAPLLEAGTLEVFEGSTPSASPVTVATDATGTFEIFAVYTPAAGSAPPACVPSGPPGAPSAPVVPRMVTRAVVRVATLELRALPGDGVRTIGADTVVATRSTNPDDVVTLVATLTPSPFCVPSNPPLVVWSGGTPTDDPLRRTVSRAATGHTPVSVSIPGTSLADSIDVFVVRVTLDVDADRDGVVEEEAEGKAAWAFGAGTLGAVLLCNNDNDDRAAGNDEIDNENVRIDGAADTGDLAPLVIRPTGPLPAGLSFRISTPDRTRLRVFSARSTAATALIGPAPLPAQTAVTTSPTSAVELGVEATGYPDDGFDGLVRLRLSLFHGAFELGFDEVVMRVAPWLMPSHLGVTVELFVVETSDNAGFVARLSTIAGAVGIPLHRTTNADRWIQDTMEIGFTRMPTKTLHAVFKSPRRRGLQAFARDKLLGRDCGYFEEGGVANTFDSHGNLEVSPPVTVGTQEFKLGRIYFGAGRPSEPFDDAVRRFLVGQRVQKPFSLDTSWLAVGHVDEVVSFVPSRIGKGFKLLIGDTTEARRILAALAAGGHGGRTLFTGKSEEISVDDLRTELARTTVGSLGWANDLCQRRITGDPAAGFEGVEAKLRSELGLKDDDIVRIPALFVESDFSPRPTPVGGDPTFDALIPAMVNLLVITGSTFARHRLVLTDPFGPSIGGSDPFEADVRAKLAALGYAAGQIIFVDVYDTYHLGLGEVHCGTNSRRAPDTTPWWEQTDF